jgi:hypothetical protein
MFIVAQHQLDVTVRRFVGDRCDQRVIVETEWFRPLIGKQCDPDRAVVTGENVRRIRTQGEGDMITPVEDMNFRQDMRRPQVGDPPWLGLVKRVKSA